MGSVPEGLRIPALTLQPLIENAIYHGVEPRGEPSLVTITVDYNGREVSIVIVNPVAPVLAHSRGNKMAVANIRQRLQAHYGDTARLTTHADDAIYTTYISYPLSLRNEAQPGTFQADAPPKQEEQVAEEGV
jgi:two-component system sensor histidine kinase AlgZ